MTAGSCSARKLYGKRIDILRYIEIKRDKGESYHALQRTNHQTADRRLQPVRRGNSRVYTQQLHILQFL